MKSMSRFAAAVAAGFLATCSAAFAAPNFVPEPDSVALVALGVAGVVLFSRKAKK